MPITRNLAGWAVAVLLAFAGQAAAAPLTPPERFVDAFGGQAVEVIQATAADPAARRARFGDLARRDLDLRTIAALVLGRSWRGADDEARARFARAFEDHLIDTYSRRLEGYSGQRPEVTGARQAGDDVMVASRVAGADGQPIQIDWRVREKAGSWRIIDASVEGVSMVVTWRNEFAAVIQKVGLNGLIDQLQQPHG